MLLNDERSLNMHLKTHNIECEVCAKTFKNKDSMKSHKSKVHKPNDKKYCKFCKKLFSSKDSLMQHMFFPNSFDQ